jgi:hypothetical protein
MVIMRVLDFATSIISQFKGIFNILVLGSSTTLLYLRGTDAAGLSGTANGDVVPTFPITWATLAEMHLTELVVSIVEWQ